MFKYVKTFLKLTITVSIRIILNIFTIFIKKDNNILIFGGWYGKRFADNSKYLYLYASYHKVSIRAIWITKSKNIYRLLKENNLEVYYANSIQGIYYSLKGAYHFIDQTPQDINDLCTIKATSIQLWHGIGIKKVGYYKQQRKLSRIRKKLETLYLTLRSPKKWREGNYFLLTTGPYTSNILSKTFNCPVDQLIEVGYPRIDKIINKDLFAMFDSKSTNEVNELMKKLKKNNTKIIGYFPTFRDQETDFMGLENKEQLNSLLDYLEKNNLTIITKEHSVVQNSNSDICKDARIIYIDSSIDIYEILDSIDVLITDYSTIYQDYLFLDKPIIFYDYDFDYYVNQDRGLMEDYKLLTAVGPHVHNLNSLYLQLDNITHIDISYSESRKKILELLFNKSSQPYSERILNFFDL